MSTVSLYIEQPSYALCLWIPFYCINTNLKDVVFCFNAVAVCYIYLGHYITKSVIPLKHCSWMHKICFCPPQATQPRPHNKFKLWGKLSQSNVSVIHVLCCTVVTMFHVYIMLMSIAKGKRYRRFIKIHNTKYAQPFEKLVLLWHDTLSIERH